MSNIDFTPTAYTVTTSGSGKPGRYEGENWKYAIEGAKRELARLTEAYPNMARLVVPDHFVQEYCRNYDRNLWSGGRGFGVHGDSAFFELAEKGLAHSKFN
jgi:hypothetical protein